MAKTTATELSRFPYSLITLIVICYNAVRHKSLWLRGVDCCLLMFSRKKKPGQSSSFALLLISLATVWPELHAAVLLLPTGTPMWKVMSNLPATKGHSREKKSEYLFQTFFWLRKNMKCHVSNRVYIWLVHTLGYTVGLGISGATQIPYASLDILIHRDRAFDYRWCCNLSEPEV